MSGIVAGILVPTSFTPADSGRINSILRELFGAFRESRKGRHWEFTVSNVGGSLSVVSTSTHGYEFESDLLAYDLSTAAVPDALVISFGIKSRSTQDATNALRERLIHEFNGIACRQI